MEPATSLVNRMLVLVLVIFLFFYAYLESIETLSEINYLRRWKTTELLVMGKKLFSLELF